MEARIRRIEGVIEQIEKIRAETREYVIQKYVDNEFLVWLYKKLIDQHFESALAELLMARERLEELKEWQRKRGDV